MVWVGRQEGSLFFQMYLLKGLVIEEDQILLLSKEQVGFTAWPCSFPDMEGCTLRRYWDLQVLITS